MIRIAKPRLRVRAIGLGTSVAQTLLRALWFVVIPALLAGVTLRYFFPAAVEPAATSVADGLSHLRVEFPVPLTVALFLFFAALAHYWRLRLPGGAYLAAALPALETARFRPDQLDEVSAGFELRRLLENQRMRLRIERKLTAPQIEELDARLSDLAGAIDIGDTTRARVARLTALKLATPALRVRNLRRGALLAFGVFIAAFAAFQVRTSVFQSYRVLSASMLPTLQPGDYVGGNKLAYGLRLPLSTHARSTSAPRRGDVVVFQRLLPGANAPEHLVKRVIGLPGDRIMMYAGFPIINGWKVPNCYAGPYFYLAADGKSVSGRLSVEFLEDKTYLTVHTPTHRQVEAYEVKSGEIFVLGDNRNASLDSRTWKHDFGGGVPMSAVVGRADRLMVHADRDGGLHPGSILQPLEALNLNLDNVDTSALRSGIETCLANRPKESKPPPESAPLPGDLARQ